MTIEIKGATSEGRLEQLLEATGVGTWTYDSERGILDFSAALKRLYRFPPEMAPETLEAGLELVYPEDRESVREAFESVLSGRAEQFSLAYRRLGGDGQTRWVSVRGRGAEMGDNGLPRRIYGTTIDLTERHEERIQLELSNAILQRISTATPLSDVLDFIARAIEQEFAGIQCSILLIDEAGLHLRHGAAPTLPDAYCKAIDGAPIGPSAGSCGTAAYRGETVFVADIATDPLWVDYCELAGQFGLAACWSSPIRASSGTILGTFAIYWGRPRPVADPMLQHYVEMSTRLAAVAIERDRHESRLRGVIDELRRWQQVIQGREGRVMELKGEVNQLLERLGEAPRYRWTSRSGEAQ